MLINNNEFDMYSYFKTDIGLNVVIANTTFTEIETAVGDSAEVEIGEDYKGYHLILVSCTRNNGMIDVTFIDQNLVNKIANLESDVASLNSTTSQNTDDIEANAEAIVELAELIGGGE